MSFDIREYLYAKVYTAEITKGSPSSIAKSVAEQSVKDFDKSDEKLDLY